MDLPGFLRPLDPEELEDARTTLKNLLPLLPEDALRAFLAADNNGQVIIHRKIYGWHFGAGAEPLGDWQIGTHTEFGQAYLTTPEGTFVPIRTGWHEIPRLEDSTIPGDLDDG